MEITNDQPKKEVKPYQIAAAKVVCYYSHYKDGTPRPQDQIKTGRNRTAHPLYSSFLTDKQQWYTDQKAMVKKALRHIQIHEQKIISAVVYLVNHKSKKEYEIGKYVNGKGWEFWFEPEFTTPDHNGNIFISKVNFNREFNFLAA